ncbi:MAG TPA: sigma-70 family RNA polymerase sigma factor [Planctomycetaceae bacterium]|nr:sigma-70 family RNA polymerase sigma factor [Planctomycetaceae bacterium]
MNFANTTRVSLIYRLRDHQDSEAWGAFVDLYGPLIYRFGRYKGMQDADSADLAQDVLREVAKAMPAFDYDPAIGKFRSWLFLVTRRTLARRLRSKGRTPVAIGDTAFLKRLSEMPESSSDEQWELEYRQRLFQWALEQVKPEFNGTTWKAFWRTAVDGAKPVKVAEQLSLKVGSVYVSKNRVLRRLREVISTVDEGAIL